MRILHVTETTNGGVLQVIQQLCQYAAESNEITAVGLAYSLRDSSDLSAVKQLPGLEKTFELTLTRNVSINSDIKGFKQLINLFKIYQPDIVHLHSSKAGILGRLAARICRIPVCYSPHGYAFLRRDVNFATRKLYYLAEYAAGKCLAGTTIACGDTELRYANKFSRAALVRNGVELPALVNKVKDNSPLKIGTMGRICAQKGVDLFIQLVNRLPNTIRWVWIGDGELRHKLASLPQVEITSWLDRRQALEQLHNLDIYIQTSAWEGLPLSLLEAMACAKPVVATQIIGNQDAVLHGKTGFLAHDVAEMCNYIEQLINSATLRQHLGQCGRERIASDFNSEKNIPRYFSIYANMLGSR